MRKWGGRRAARLVAACLVEYGDRCHLAGPMCTGRATTADHVVPHSRGGADVLANLRPACLPCNQARGAMPLAEWRELHGQATPLLAPSRQWL